MLTNRLGKKVIPIIHGVSLSSGYRAIALRASVKKSYLISDFTTHDIPLPSEHSKNSISATSPTLSISSLAGRVD